MPDIRSVVIIGAGTIGRAVGASLAAGSIAGFRLSGYVVRTPLDELDAPTFLDLDEAFEEAPRVVVEAAGQSAVRELAARVLAAGSDLVCCSVGALADPQLRANLDVAARQGGSRLLVPSGAVGGLDALRAAAEAGLAEVVIEQRKPPATLLPVERADALTEPLVVFDGPVADVVARYPTTTNVAAAVALAGLGFERTRAIVVADPALRANVAVLTARGRFGMFTLRLENVATSNPRTSAVTAASVVATLRRLDATVVIPA